MKGENKMEYDALKILEMARAIRRADSKYPVEHYIEGAKGILERCSEMNYQELYEELGGDGLDRIWKVLHPEE
jgi:hypothetical protein